MGYALAVGGDPRRSIKPDRKWLRRALEVLGYRIYRAQLEYPFAWASPSITQLDLRALAEGTEAGERRREMPVRGPLCSAMLNVLLALQLQL